MKKRYFIKTAVLSLMATALLSSCLKDNAHFVDFAASKPLVEFPAAAGVVSGSNVVVEALGISATPTVLPIEVNVAAPKPLTTALTVTIAIDTAQITAYNAANGTSYVLLPPADYTLSALQVTIPANQYSANITLSVKTTVIDPSQVYMLPLTIVNGGGQQISNWKTVLYAIQVKNPYDGEYTVTGTMADHTNPALVGAYPIDAYLETTGANTDFMYSVQFSGPAHDILNGGSPSYYGSFAPVFTFTGNTISAVTNYYGQPAPGATARSARIDATGVNATTGTPGTSGFSFQVSYVMVQAGADRTFFTETWTYVKPRP